MSFEPLTQGTKVIVCRLIVIAAVAVAGCGPRPETGAASETPEPAVAPAASAAAAAPDEADSSASAPEMVDINTILSELTQAVRKYGMEQTRRPANLEELVTAGYLPNVPEPPAGKRFAISKDLRVYLADK